VFILNHYSTVAHTYVQRHWMYGEKVYTLEDYINERKYKQKGWFPSKCVKVDYHLNNEINESQASQVENGSMLKQSDEKQKVN
jgi:hypothetical protein